MAAREYREGAHTVYDIKVHLVWVTKYRHKVLRGEVGTRTRDLIRQVCAAAELRRRYWGQHLWARGYFCASSGTVTDEMIKAYIDQQDVPPDDGFRVAD